MAAARLLLYILFKQWRWIVFVPVFLSDMKLWLWEWQQYTIFFFKFNSFECPEVSRFSCVKREEMKGFLIDSYRKSLLSQGTLRQQIKHRCLQNVTYPKEDKWTSSELDIWLRFKRPGFSSAMYFPEQIVWSLYFGTSSVKQGRTILLPDAANSYLGLRLILLLCSYSNKHINILLPVGLIRSCCKANEC